MPSMTADIRVTQQYGYNSVLTASLVGTTLISPIAVQKNDQTAGNDPYSVNLSKKARSIKQEYETKKQKIEQNHKTKKQKIESEYKQERQKLEQEYERKRKSMGLSLYA